MADVVGRCLGGAKFVESIKSWRGSRKLVLFIVFVALLLDNMLLTTVVPIIPNFLHQLDLDSNPIQKDTNQTNPYNIPTNCFHSTSKLSPTGAHFTSNPLQKNPSLPLFNSQTPGLSSSLNSYSVHDRVGDATTSSTTGRRKSRRKFRLRRQTSITEIAKTTTKVSDVDEEMKAENVAVGLMFASKAVVQLVVNPFVGPVTNRIGYSIPMFTGFVIMFLSTLTFAFGKSYAVLFIARSVQGIGSACSSVSGMGMLANLYTDDKERGDAMAIALGGLAFGVLIGPPFGGVMYQFFGKEAPFLVLAVLALGDGLLQLVVLQPKVQAEEEAGSTLKELLSDPYILIAAASITFANMGIAVLEPTLPLHMLEVMKSEKWEQGAAFLPCSIAYLIGTNLFGPLSHKFGRWLSAMVGMMIIGMCLFIIPLATSAGHLILPNFGLGFSIGMVDSSMLPIMGHLVDIRHVPIYGSVYAITDVAFCLGFAVGPALSGSILNALGFKWMLWIMAIIDLLYSPFLFFLRSPPSRSEKQALMLTAATNPNTSTASNNINQYKKFNNVDEIEEVSDPLPYLSQ